VNTQTLLFLCVVLFIIGFVWIVRSMYVLYTQSGGPQQVVALTEGETFVGVIERRRGQYVFIVNDWGRYQASLTPQEIQILRAEFYQGYE
jgi:hypothetical protein